MSSSSQIDPAIIEARKRHAPRLRDLLDRAEACSAALTGLKVASQSIDGPKQPLLDAIERSLHRLEQLRERAAIRHQRFVSGLVTIAVAGIEKSGKTTLLKTLTGIENLPTANERCTAVCCEIRHDSRNTFDLEFHSDEEFCQNVLHPLIDAFNKSSASGTEPVEPLALPGTLADFGALILPSKGRFPAGTHAWIVLDALDNLQRHPSELGQYIGTSPRRGIALPELSGWVVNHHDDAKARAKVAAVSRCILYTPFDGGSENLRWIDTPGVDDPSPLARERALKTVGHDADLLVVATMPRDTPDPTDSFIHFWTSIRQLRDEVDLMQRLLILLNWKKDADPQKTEIAKHRATLERRQEVPPGLFCGPLEANQPEDVRGFMAEVNRHLAAHLPGQDERVAERLENELRSCLAEVRTSVFDLASRLSPADGAQSDVETSLFLKWFNDAALSGQQTGFWPRLREMFVRAVAEIPKSEAVVKAQADLSDIFKEHTKRIGASLPTEENMRVRLEQNAGTPPITAYMQIFSTGGFSGLINDLAKQVGEFGPIMQQAILRTFREAGLAPLLPEGDPQETLRHLHELLESAAPVSESQSPVLEALDELAGLKQSLQYVYRWEMRPAINFLSPLHWNQGNAVEDLARLLEQGGTSDQDKAQRSQELRDYFGRTRLPGIQDPPQAHAQVFGQICKFALLGVRSVLDGGRCRLDNIADDFVRDFQTRLTFSAVTEQAWRDVLLPHRGRLLGQEIANIRANSEKLARFRSAVEALGVALP